jgi:hypothetical protein
MTATSRALTDAIMIGQDRCLCLVRGTFTWRESAGVCLPPFLPIRTQYAVHLGSILRDIHGLLMP